MDSPGARLKQVRLAKGCTLEEAHRKTRINIHIIQAIEEDSVANINPVYLKGFIKIYCAFLGVDPAEYFSAETPAGSRPQQEVRQPSVPPSRPEPAQAAPAEEKVTKPLHGTGLKVTPRSAPRLRPDPRMIRIAAAVAGAVFLLFIAGKIGVFIKNRPARRSSRPPAVRSAPAVKPRAASRTQPKQPKSAPSAEQSFPQSADSEIRLVIRAKEDCWVNLKADGKVVFRSLLRKGRFENFTFKERGELSLGNAGAVELEINGKFIPNLGRRGQALKNIVISRKGLETGR